jgi:hypothetical protein
MKKNKLLTVLFVVLIASTISNAQNYKAQNITKTGDITDSIGKAVGKVTKDGNVFNSQGQKLGSVDANGVVTDKTGKKLGRAAKNGDFYDMKETIVLRTNEKGDVKDSKGHTIGKVDPAFKQHACVIHCFFCHTCQ